jgi:hypothetical protein
VETAHVTDDRFRLSASAVESRLLGDEAAASAAGGG